VAFKGVSHIVPPSSVRLKKALLCAAAHSARMRQSGDRSGEVAMILVVLDPRTGKRVAIDVAETAKGKQIVRKTRLRA
jgi:hypothetical protein